MKNRRNFLSVQLSWEFIQNKIMSGEFVSIRLFSMILRSWNLRQIYSWLFWLLTSGVVIFINTCWKGMLTYLFIIESTVNNPPIFMHGSAIASLYLTDGDILPFQGIIISLCVSSTERNTRTNHQQCHTSPQLPLDHCWQHLTTFESFHRVETPPTGPEITQI